MRAVLQLIRASLLSAFVCLAPSAPAAAAPLAYAPAPPDNPLKGFVPYAGRAPDFPHSLEFNYLPLQALMAGPERFTWEPLERLLSDIAGRGCQTVVRVYLEYPGRPTGVPQFLIDAGVRLRSWTNTNTQPFPPKIDHTPDYEDPRLRTALTNFITALGARYDGDPRIGFVTAGLLGTWGEWHTHPHPEWFASKTVQTEVMDAYEAAFQKTPVLLRYPAGEKDRERAANHARGFGYHDDSFAWATLPTGRKGDAWFFLALLNQAGPEALAKWRTRPIGGEIRPEVWPCLWTEAGCREGQDYFRCVEETHATWLMDTSTSRRLTPGQRERAMAGARKLGYEFHVASAEFPPTPTDRHLPITLTITNTGVAPFYRDWPVELAALDPSGEIAATWRPSWKLTGILPGDSARRWSFSADLSELGPGQYCLALRVPNPMPGGQPLRFANTTQDQHRPGWLSLGEFRP
jgi:hypothetical protein